MMAAKQRNGLVRTVTVGAIIGGLGLLVNTGFCIPPWDQQSKAAADAAHTDLEKSIRTVNHNVIRLGDKLDVDNLKELDDE
jgi:hypothetical protein